jgi:predicted nucleic acid-binding Zn ribbon protein
VNTLSRKSSNPRESEAGARRSLSRHDDHSLKAAEVFPKLLKQLGLNDRMWQETLTEDWRALVGEQVARHARPGRLEHGTLFVYVTHSIWLSELQRNGQKQILANLQDKYGSKEIRRIRLLLDPDLGKQG